MIRIVFFKASGVYTGFSCKGHSDYSESGSDIVCAAVTGAVRLTECAINDVYKLSAQVTVNEAQAEITLSLPSLSGERSENAKKLLTALFIYFQALSKEYPDFIELKETNYA